MFEFIRRWFGNAKEIGPPAGKTGNQWTPDDFAGLTSPLATQGGPEFADYCAAQGACDLDGDVLEKFKGVLAKYSVADDMEYDYFAVVVRERLISHGLLPQGDPQRYQYKVAQLAPLLVSEA
jgi:hypothetical protein